MAEFALEQYRARGHIMHMGYETVEVQDAECSNWHKQERQKQQQEQQGQQAHGRQQEQGASDGANGTVHTLLDPDRIAGHAAVTNGVPVNKEGAAGAGRPTDVTAVKDQGDFSAVTL